MQPAERAHYDLRYRLRSQDAFYNLRYGIGIVAETVLACWLLTGYRNFAGAWVAYFLLATSAIALLVGFFWYWMWFAQRGAGAWYLTGVTLFLGAGLFAAGTYFHNESLPPWGFGFALLAICGLLVYGVWRLLRFVMSRLFSILLVAISQIGAAWRGELPS